MKFLSYLILSFLGLSSAKHAAKFKWKNNNKNQPQQQQQQHQQHQPPHYQKKKQVVEYIEHFPMKRPSPVGIAQETYVDYLEDASISIVAAFGSAGTGKTMFACHSAMESLHA